MDEERRKKISKKARESVRKPPPYDFKSESWSWERTQRARKVYTKKLET